MPGKRVMLGAGVVAAALIVGSADIGIRVGAAEPCAPPLPPPRVSRPESLRILAGLLHPSFTSWISAISSPAYAADARHAYFETLSARAECKAAYSLRSAEQLLAFTNNPRRLPLLVTYDPKSDRDSRRQDAAKVVIQPNVVSLKTHVRLPIPNVENDSLLVTWDSWLGKEFTYEKTGIGNLKHFQFASPKRIWTEVKSDFNAAKAPALALVQVRFYGQKTDETYGPNVTNRHPLSPMKNQFGIMPETWTRYWAYFNPTGKWHEFSLWVADEKREPLLINDRLQIRPNHRAGATGWNSFWLEYNSSSHGKKEGFGERVAYVRNVVMLRGIKNVDSLLKRPTQ